MHPVAYSYEPTRGGRYGIFSQLLFGRIMKIIEIRAQNSMGGDWTGGRRVRSRSTMTRLLIRQK